MKVLTVITSPQNDEGSQMFVDKLNKVSKKYQEVSVNFILCEDQSALERLLENTDGKIILVEPTDLKLKKQDYVREADLNYVADAVTDMITDPSREYLNPYTDKILILGRGLVAQAIFTKLAIDNDYCVTITNSQPELTNEYLTTFSAIINCTNVNATPRHFFNGKVFDVAGNYKTLPIYENHTIYGLVEMLPDMHEKISCGKIGTELCHKILTKFSIGE